jgi:ribonucleotide monophosphatase NagD (HAD superfamily)
LGGKKRSDADTTQAAFTTHSTLSELLKEFDYDALILDQFGVLHNGKHALDGAIDCVEAIASGANAADPSTERNQKKLQLIVLSNTSSPSETTLDRLEMKLGFDRSYFCGAVTSGEEAARHIRETYGTNEDGSKQKFVWCTWDSTNENVPDPSAFLDLCGPNVEPTLDIASSDFVVAHGSGAIRGFETKDGKVELEIRSMGSFLDDGNLKEGTPINALLGECADRKLPLICANPDMVVQYHDGSLKHMPGKIAQRYREILEERSRSSNGKTDKDLPSITIYGKPHTEHFEACLRELEDDRRQRGEGSKDETKPPTPLRVAHVGDSLHHDVAGANASGVPSIFIVGGIHAEELLSQNDTNKKGMPSEAKLRELFDKEGITPTHVLPVFNY